MCVLNCVWILCVFLNMFSLFCVSVEYLRYGECSGCGLVSVVSSMCSLFFLVSVV